MLSPLRHMSPFDVNMSLDADMTRWFPISMSSSRKSCIGAGRHVFAVPEGCCPYGCFIGGKDAVLALDMLEQVRKTLLKPFEISAFADPAGSFTTAAAMVACVEKLLKQKKGKALADARIVIFGATGPVGYTSGVIAALEGADVTLTARELNKVQAKADEIKQRFGVTVHAPRQSHRKR